MMIGACRCESGERAQRPHELLGPPPQPISALLPRAPRLRVRRSRASWPANARPDARPRRPMRPPRGGASRRGAGGSTGEIRRDRQLEPLGRIPVVASSGTSCPSTAFRPCQERRATSVGAARRELATRRGRVASGASSRTVRVWPVFVSFTSPSASACSTRIVRSLTCRHSSASASPGRRPA